VELKAAVRLIGTVEDIHGAQVRVGVDYAAVTVSAPLGGGNCLSDQQLVEFMGYLQVAYEDETRRLYAEDAEDDRSREEFDKQGLNWMGQ